MVDRNAEVVTHVSEHTAQSRRDPGIHRNQDFRHAKLACQHTRVHRAGATEGDAAEVAGVEALLDRDEADRIGHRRIGDGEDARSSRLGAKPERLANLRLYQLAYVLDVSRQVHAVDARRVDPSEQQVRVGHRGFLAAASVANWSWDRARALRADLQHAACRDPCKAPATRANGMNVDNWNAQWDRVVNALLARHRRRSIDDHRHVEARAAHVASNKTR